MCTQGWCNNDVLVFLFPKNQDVYSAYCSLMSLFFKPPASAFVETITVRKNVPQETNLYLVEV